MSDIDDFTFEDAKLWNLPSVNDEQAKLDGATNALNRPKNRWKFEAPEQEEEIIPLTAQDIELIRADAHKEGLASGHEEGYAKGHEEGYVKGKELGLSEGNTQGLEAGKEVSKAKTDEQMSALAALFDNVSTPVARINEEVKNELIILATSLAKAIVKTDIQHNSQILFDAINEGINTLPVNESCYKISLHPDDIALVNEHFGAQHIQDNAWQLVESGDLARGGCYINTSSNAVDVSIARRSDQVFTQLLLNQGLIDDPRTR